MRIPTTIFAEGLSTFTKQQIQFVPEQKALRGGPFLLVIYLKN